MKGKERSSKLLEIEFLLQLLVLHCHYNMDVLGQFLKNGNFKLVGQDSKYRMTSICVIPLSL